MLSAKDCFEFENCSNERTQSSISSIFITSLVVTSELVSLVGRVFFLSFRLFLALSGCEGTSGPLEVSRLFDRLGLVLGLIPMSAVSLHGVMGAKLALAPSRGDNVTSRLVYAASSCLNILFRKR